MKNTLGIASLSFTPLHTANYKSESFEGKILTVTGPIEQDELGFCLPHEHVTSRFGQPPAEPGQYDYQKAENEIVPYLKYIKEIGVDSLIDCTTAYFGRNVDLLKTLSEKSGVKILTNTGFYGASNDRYIPPSAFKESAVMVAGKWTDEFNNGIYNSGIRPGFIKTGIDGGGISEIDAKLVRAAAICHHATGLTIAVHTSGNIEGAKKELSILKEEGVKPEAWVWVHAHNVDKAEDLFFAAEQGAWISLDGLMENYYAEQKKRGNNNLLKHYELLKGLRDNGFIKQVLLSHDGSSFPPDGSAKRPFDFLTNSFIPMMKVGGFTDQEIDQLVKINPFKAFSIRKRLV